MNCPDDQQGRVTGVVVDVFQTFLQTTVREVELSSTT